MANCPLTLNFREKNFYKNLAQAIKIDGACIVTSFFDNEESNDIKDLELLVENIFKNVESSPDYRNGKCITYDINNNKIGLKNKIKKYIKSNLFKKDKYYKSITQNQTIKNIFTMLDNLKFSLFYSDYDEKSIYITLDKNNTSHSAQFAHYDWRPSLKAMIYLDNCNDEQSGGLYYKLKSSNETALELSEARLKGLRPGKPGSVKVKYDITKNKSSFSYCGGSAGSILIFNTDGHHYQGKNIHETPNKIIRLHSYFNKA